MEDWPKEIYSEAGTQGLILAAFYNLQHATPIPFSRLLEECFTLFPERFYFKDRPEWPDARKLGRPLRLLREKNFVEGEPDAGFSLTKKGKRQASQVVNILRQRRLDLR